MVLYTVIDDICIGVYKDNKLHQDDDKPALIFKSGIKYWYKHGKKHRGIDLNGVINPAAIYPTYPKCWYNEGVTHRIDGPAHIAMDGTPYFEYNGVDVDII